MGEHADMGLLQNGVVISAHFADVEAAADDTVPAKVRVKILGAVAGPEEGRVAVIGFRFVALKRQ